MAQFILLRKGKDIEHPLDLDRLLERLGLDVSYAVIAIPMSRGHDTCLDEAEIRAIREVLPDIEVIDYATV